MRFFLAHFGYECVSVLNWKTERNRKDRWLEARGGIEPPIKVLQTFALPLGDRAGP